MGIFSRIFGIAKTKPPARADCWSYRNGRVEVDLDRATELSTRGGAVRLEGNGLPKRILVLRGEDGGYYAYLNKCTHAGRRLDPLPGQPALECCSVNKSKFDYQGAKTGGPAKGPLTPYPVDVQGQKITIDIS